MTETDPFTESLEPQEWNGSPLFTSKMHFHLASALVGDCPTLKGEAGDMACLWVMLQPDPFRLQRDMRTDLDGAHDRLWKFIEDETPAPNSPEMAEVRSLVHRLFSAVAQANSEVDEDSIEGGDGDGLGKSHHTPDMSHGSEVSSADWTPNTFSANSPMRSA